MLPIDIFEYKKRWSWNAHIVKLHSDYRSEAKDWCKSQMLKQQWDVQQYTNVYEDTYLFEEKDDAESFARKFNIASL